jgi:hypothetical protein
MSTTQTQTKDLAAVESDAARMLAGFGIPESDPKARTAAVTAIGKATKDTLLDVVRTEAGPLYADTSALAHASAVAASFSKMGRAAVDAQSAFALRIIRAARKVDPKVSLSALGYAVEGTPETEQTRTSKIGSAVRTRWSKFGKAVDVVEASRQAVNDGKRHTMVSDTAALTAVNRQASGRGERVDLVALAASGGEMPSGKPVTDAAGETTARVYTGKDLVSAFERLSDVLASLDASDVTPEQWAAVDRIADKVRERLSGARKATPAA